MNLDKLYKMQEELDQHIIEKHNIKMSKEELLDNTILEEEEYPNGYPYIRQETYDFIKQHFTIDNVDIVKGISLKGTRYADYKGYQLISIYINKDTNRVIREHHIIGFFIFGERMIGRQINHINLNKADNRPANLEIVTASENIQHYFDNATSNNLRGINAKLTETDVVEIRGKKKEGITLKKLADEYGVVFQTISKICNYKSWEYVPDDIDLADLDFSKYQSLCKRTVNNKLDDKDEVASYALGIVSESAEVSDEVKKQLYHGHDKNPEKIKDELGDVMWYMANLATKYGLTLKDIAKHNITKLKERYPDGFSQDKSINRNEEVEQAYLKKHEENYRRQREGY